ncbi:MAG: glycosyltransferase family 4 protein [Acidimicrobiales bacterium]
MTTTRAVSRSVFHLISSTDRRGAETFASDLVRFLADRGTPGTIASLAPGSSGSPLEVPVLGASRWSPGGLLAVRRRTAGARAAVGHGSSTLLALAIAGFGTSTPFVYRNIGDPLAWAGTRSRRARVSMFLRRATVVVTLWEESSAVLSDRFGVRPERIVVIPNAGLADRFCEVTTAARGEARTNLGLEPDQPVAIYVGAMSPEKAPATLIRAISGMPGWSLVCMGDGPDLPELKALSERIAPRRIRFVAPGAEVAKVMAAADVVALASGTEGMPAIAIETGLSGLPMVASAVGGIPEVVLDQKTGVLVQPGDVSGFAAGMQTAYDHREAFGKQARLHCLTHFEMGVVADQWSALLERF